MDAERFDAIARSLASRVSRRVALRSASAGAMAGMAARAGGRADGVTAAQSKTPTPLPVCTDPSRPGVGCACASGTDNSCGDTTLLCCANDANGASGGPGVCTPSSVGCNPLGPQSSCTGKGCRCNGGVENACDSSFVCCLDDPGVAGGPGRCVRQDKCNQGECSGEGCSCNSGTKGECDDGLVCCAHDSSVAGGSGRCETEAICFGNQCQATTNPCPSSCAAGSYCKECCSGYCGADDHCGPAKCEGIGCPCNEGVEGDCSEGLVCCQSQMTAPNQPGGPGMCAAPAGCGGGSMGAAQATPVG